MVMCLACHSLPAFSAVCTHQCVVLLSFYLHVSCSHRTVQRHYAADGAVDSVRRDQVLQALSELKPGEAPGPSGVQMELVVASKDIWIQVMVELCQSSR